MFTESFILPKQSTALVAGSGHCVSDGAVRSRQLFCFLTFLYQEPRESTLFNIYLFVVCFRIRIQAVNEIGAGPFSQFIKAKTRPLPPLPPRLECAAAGPQSLKLKWGDSSSKLHATDDMVYILQIEDRNKR